MKKKSKLLKVLIIIFALGLIVSLSKFISIRYKGIKEEEAFEDLRQTVATTKVEASSKPREDEVEVEIEAKKDTEALFTKYKVLKETNPDFCGWLKISDTAIDYPVMITQDQPRFYMRRGFDKEYSLSGTPFVGVNGDVDSDMFIIYAHNMSNGTMFSQLDSYKDQEFFEDHKRFSFTTINEERTYEVFASLKVKVPVENDLAYYEYSGDLADDDYEDLVNYLTANSLISAEGPSNREEILILSTCSYHTKDGRFIIAAKRIN